MERLNKEQEGEGGDEVVFDPGDSLFDGVRVDDPSIDPDPNLDIQADIEGLSDQPVWVADPDIPEVPQVDLDPNLDIEADIEGLWSQPVWKADPGIPSIPQVNVDPNLDIEADMAGLPSLPVWEADPDMVFPSLPAAGLGDVDFRASLHPLLNPPPIPQPPKVDPGIVFPSRPTAGLPGPPPGINDIDINPNLDMGVDFRASLHPLSHNVDLPELNTDVSLPEVDPSALIPQLNPDFNVTTPEKIDLRIPTEIPYPERPGFRPDFEADPRFKLENPINVDEFRGPGIGFRGDVGWVGAPGWPEPEFKLENPINVDDFRPSLNLPKPERVRPDISWPEALPPIPETPSITPSIGDLDFRASLNPISPEIPSGLDLERPDFTFFDDLSFGPGFDNFGLDIPRDIPDWMKTIPKIDPKLPDISTTGLTEAIKKIVEEGAKTVYGYTKDELARELRSRIPDDEAADRHVTAEELPGAEMVPWIGGTELVESGIDIPGREGFDEFTGDDFFEGMTDEWNSTFEELNIKNIPHGVNIDFLGSILSNWGPTKKLTNWLMGGTSRGDDVIPLTLDTELRNYVIDPGGKNARSVKFDEGITVRDMLAGWLHDRVYIKNEGMRRQGIPPSMRREILEKDLERGYFNPPDLDTVVKIYADNGKQWMHSDYAKSREDPPPRTEEEEKELRRLMWERRTNPRDRKPPPTTPRRVSGGHDYAAARQDASQQDNQRLDSTEADKFKEYSDWASSPEGKSEFRSFHQQIFNLHGRHPTKEENEAWTASRMEALENPPQITANQIYESWNLALGEPGFNPAADANNDGIINSLDLQFAS